MATQAPDEKTRRHPANVAAAYIFLALVIAAVAALVWCCLRANPEGQKTDAYLISQQFVETRLTSPGSAQFPMYLGGMGEARVGRLENGDFVIKAYVDSQNAFGALVRTYYTCTVRKLDKDKWQLVDLELTPG